MDEFDYVIVGSGPAGCVLANRLSADPKVTVALIEAGPPANHPFVTMPKGFGKLLTGSPLVSHYRTEPDAGGTPHVWARGKTLGGSTSVNGMAYSRGQPEDYDAWAATGVNGWGWAEMLPAFRAIEDHELGADAERGAGGPLHVGINRARNRPNDAVLKAAERLGLPVREDVNRAAQVGIGPMPHMIRKGRRISAANAFLDPVRNRPNLTVLTGLPARKILFEGVRAVGAECRGRKLAARREVILSAGAFETPKLLMLSGIGPAEQLLVHGIEVRVDRPMVGENMAEHRGIAIQFRLKERLSHNPQFSGPRLLLNVARYYASRTGIMAYGSHELMGFARVLPDSPNADTQMFISPFSRVPGQGMVFEKQPGMQCLIYAGRPTSRGSVHLRSADPEDLPLITPAQLETEHDQAVSVAMVRFIRTLFATEPLASLIAEETCPGPRVAGDEDILDAIRKGGTWGYHTVGTARMGEDEDAVVDGQLRVRGVEGLRVVDASVFPGLVSANTTGPVVAVAWRAADLILGA
jgi:choline dehydrogenase-like flavoprotein